MKKGKSHAVRPVMVEKSPRKRGFPFLRGNKSLERDFLVQENRELKEVITSLKKRVFGLYEAARRMKEIFAERSDILETRVRYLEAVLASTDAAVIVADISGTIRIFNQSAENLFEMNAANVVGDNFFRLCGDFTADDKRRYGRERLDRIFMREESITNMRVDFIGMHGKVTPSLFTLNFVEDAGERIAIVAVIKDNSEVEKLTRTDELTDIANRRHLLYMIKREYARMERGHYKDVSLLFFDVDNFGSFNKEYGHQVGDEVLRVVAGVAKEQTRWLDTIGRYGGEEFVIVMPGTDAQGALKFADRVRTAVENAGVSTDEFGELSVTISIGAQTHTVESAMGVELLIREANTAMLVAKLRGKNCSLCYNAEHTEIMRRFESSEKTNENG